MEAVCPQCSMRYEVSQELLQQGPVACPTCQVGLVFVEPGTTTPLEPQPQAGPVTLPQPGETPAARQQEDNSQSEAQESASGEQAKLEQLQETPATPEQPAEQSTTEPAAEQPATEPATEQPAAEPAPGSPGEQAPPASWGAGDLLWGDSGTVSDVAASPAETTSAGQDGEAAGEVTASAHDESTLIPELPQEPASESESVAAPVGVEQPPPEAATATVPPAAEQSAAETDPEVAPAIEQPPEQPAADQAATAQPPVAAGAFETPTWQPTSALPAEESTNEPAPNTAAPPAVETAQPDDWAAAAARWAASGFSAEAMPKFVGDQGAEAAAESPTEQAAGSGPVQPPEPRQSLAADPVPAAPEAAAGTPGSESVAQPIPGAASAPATNTQPSPATPQQPQSPQSPPSPPAGNAAPAPPPLPGEGSGKAVAVEPPPLRRISTYIMRGSGEGKDDAPWAGAPASEPPRVAVPVSTAKPAAGIKVPVPSPEAAPVQVPVVPRPSGGRGLWWLLVILLVAAGAAFAWWWVKTHGSPVKEDKVEVPATPPPPVKLEQPQPKPGETAGQIAGGSAGKSGKVAAEKPAGKKTAPTTVPAGKIVTGKTGNRQKKLGGQRSASRGKYRTREAINLVKQGNAMIKSGKFKKALLLFRKALRADPRVALAHRGLGVAYAYLKKTKAACREYRKYYKMLPKNSSERPQLEQILKGCK